MNETHEKMIYRAGFRLLRATGRLPESDDIERELGGFPGERASGRSKASNWRKMMEVAAEEGFR